VLIGPVWQWQQTTLADGSVTAVKTPDRYMVQFMEDGIAVGQADCNRANGVYSVAGETVSIKLAAMTRAACARGSLSMQFVEQLNNAETFAFAGANLVIRQAGGAGEMVFAGVK